MLIQEQVGRRGDERKKGPYTWCTPSPPPPLVIGAWHEGERKRREGAELPIGEGLRRVVSVGPTRPPSLVGRSDRYGSCFAGQAGGTDFWPGTCTSCPRIRGVFGLPQTEANRQNEALSRPCTIFLYGSVFFFSFSKKVTNGT